MRTLQKSTLYSFVAMIVFAGVTLAGQPNVCPPTGCPDYGNQSYQIQVPVTKVVDVPETVTYTRMVPFTRDVEVPRGKWVMERKQVPSTRTIYVNEPYTVNETRYEYRPETRMRQVNRRVRDVEQRQVNETVYTNVYDQSSCRWVRVPRNVCRTISVPVTRNVCVSEPYTARVRVPVTVPVTKYRKVAKTVPCNREVKERRWVTEMVREQVTEMRPVTESRVQMRQQRVCTTELVNQPIGTPVPTRM